MRTLGISRIVRGLQRTNVYFHQCKHFGTTQQRNRAPATPESEPQQLNGENIMQLASNRAMRYVFMRTLPLKANLEVKEKVEDIAAQIEESTRTLCEKHIPTLSDERAAVHLHTAALAIATHRILEPRVKNRLQLSNIIRAGFGAMPTPDPSASPQEYQAQQVAQKARPDFWIVRAALWFSFDRMAAIRRMTSNMLRDFGSTFSSESVDDEIDGKASHTVFVKKCYYHKLCKEEGVPHLTSVFCSLDRALYSPISVKSHGIEFKLEKTLPDFDKEEAGEGRCEFRFIKHK